MPENKGLGNALKVAVENCSYELIARMDSDDIAVENRFEQQNQLLFSYKPPAFLYILLYTIDPSI